VAWGDLDLPFALAQWEDLVVRIAGARAVRLPGTAHLPNLEAPERFDPPVAAFLAELDGRGPVGGAP
jgi:pimeloyl-ACP methyl ester carboxylesterase